MSQFYNYDFISPVPVYALIQEDLKSYFDAHMVDNLLFPIWTEKCLKKLGRGTYKIVPTVLHINNNEARLPDNFHAVREAWLCTTHTMDYQLSNAQYQEVSSLSTKISSGEVYCDKCTECGMPDIIKAVYKTTNRVMFHFRRQYLLRPGNIWSKGHCGEECMNFHSHGPESFEVRDNKFVVSFKEGLVYLLYYFEEIDEATGYQMIPDNVRIKEYIEYYIKYKLFEQLFNQVSDESFSQIQTKMGMYKQMADEAMILAQIEIKKETIYKKHQKMVRELHRFDIYKLPDDVNNRTIR